MAYPSQLATKRHQHRLHLYLHSVIVQSAMELNASDHVFGEKRWLPPHFDVHMPCLREQRDIVIPIKGVLNDALYNPPPKRYLLRLTDQPVRNTSNTIIFTGFAEVNRAFHRGLFVTYTEAGIEWVKQNISTDVKKWPPIANFCRVVRNALVHGGVINIKSEDAPTVSWEGVTYNHKSLGQIVLDQDLYVGDLVILLFAFNDELDELGAPFDLG